MKITKGQIVALTEGEFSEYGLREHVRALMDLDTEAEMRRFMETPEYKIVSTDYPDGDEHGSVDRFIAWLAREGMTEVLEASEVTEWWLGEYGCIQFGGVYWPKDALEMIGETR